MHLLFRLPSGALWLALMAAAIMSIELGHWLGQRHRRTLSDASLDQLGTFQGGMFGTLGLLLGFTLSIGVSHFDQRRALVVEEANAIGTVYLRTSFLPDEEREEGRRVLKEYVRLRLDAFEHRREFTGAREQMFFASSADLQRRLWLTAERTTQKDSRPLINLFVSAVNELIDLDTSRHSALEAHIPYFVIFIVFSFAEATLMTVGYVSGARSGQRLSVWYLLSLLLCSILLLIVDLDRPRLGLIPVNHDAMYLQHRSME
jgi:hypothetical protein